MIEYIYFVKCDGCEDEPFYFFDEAKECAVGCLKQKPVITQVEVNRNDFGECVDSCDLGTVWSWEDECKDCQEVEKAPEVFTRGDFAKYADKYNPDNDPEFTDDVDKEPSEKPSLLTKDFLNQVETDEDPEFATLDNSVEEPEIDQISVLDEVPDNFSKPLVEGKWGAYFKSQAEWDEFKKLCDEIGIYTISDVEMFMKDQDATPDNLLTKLRAYRAELGPDFKIKEARKPIPDDMTIEQLVEEMEENEEEVECTWCNDLYPKDQCRKEVDLGYLCPRCEAAIKSRGETLTFRENDYWDFLDEDIDDEISEDDFFNQDFDVTYDADYEGAMAIEAEEDEAVSEIEEISTPEEAVDFLVRDEEEAVAGYEAAAEIVEASDAENKEEILDVIEHIKEEEIEHIEELEALVEPTEEASEDEIDEVSDEEEIEVEEEILTEDAEAEQELEGTDNAVVDCKVADVITHSEDEKPVDCEGKKKPLEQPLTEATDVSYLANIADAKTQIVDNLKNNSSVAKFIQNNDICVPYEYKSKFSASGSFTDGKLVGFSILSNGRIELTQAKVRNGQTSYIHHDFDSVLDAAPRGSNTRMVLKELQTVATQLNKQNKPNIRVRRDISVFNMLKENPTVAQELKDHIKKIKYRIPLIDYYSEDFEVDKNGDPLTERALDKIINISNNFFELPFAQDAFNAGIVENRPATEEYNHYIESSWAAEGIITFDCQIKMLSKEARDVISDAKVKTDLTASEETNVTHCYRLANALIRYFDNDIWFFKKASTPTSSTQAVDSGVITERLDDEDERHTVLGLCPECGEKGAFDYESGVCNNCGFIL